MKVTTILSHCRPEALNELRKLKDHANCLAAIPRGIGTQRNESLHRKLNLHFSNRPTIGFEKAHALIKTLLHYHNKKLGSYVGWEDDSMVASTHTSTYFEKRFDESNR